jgi:zinc protease
VGAARRLTVPQIAGTTAVPPASPVAPPASEPASSPVPSATEPSPATHAEPQAPR